NNSRNGYDADYALTGYPTAIIQCKHNRSNVMNRLWIVITWSTLVAIASAQSPDLIVHHAKIVTLDLKSPIVEAMAIRGDRIIALGINAQIAKLATKNTKQIDAGGKCVIPGLIDSHVHPAGAALYEFDHPVPEMETVADVLKHIAQRAEQLNE